VNAPFFVIPAFIVIPAKAGIHSDSSPVSHAAWIPACAGMTGKEQGMGIEP
jgi:hypothetical protein